MRSFIISPRAKLAYAISPRAKLAYAISPRAKLAYAISPRAYAWIVVAFTFSLGHDAHAEPTKKAIQIGDVEVNGEVRRPPIEMMTPESPLTASARRLAVQELKEFEEQILKPGNYDSSRMLEATRKKP